MSLSIEGERIRGASATPKRCLDEWLLYSLGLFSIGDRAQTRITVSHRELSRSREGCNVGPCLTSSYISPHNRAPRQIPLFVHILCIVTRVSRGTQGARTTSGEYVLSFFPFLSFFLFSSPSFFLSLFLLVLIFLYRPRVSSSSSFSPASSSSSRSISCSFHTRRGGGWDQIVYLPDKNRIESCHENRPLIMRIPRIAIIQHPIPSSRLFLFFFFFFFSSPSLARNWIGKRSCC